MGLPDTAPWRQPALPGQASARIPPQEVASRRLPGATRGAQAQCGEQHGGWCALCHGAPLWHPGGREARWSGACFSDEGPALMSRQVAKMC